MENTPISEPSVPSNLSDTSAVGKLETAPQPINPLRDKAREIRQTVKMRGAPEEEIPLSPKELLLDPRVTASEKDGLRAIATGFLQANGETIPQRREKDEMIPDDELLIQKYFDVMKRIREAGAPQSGLQQNTDRQAAAFVRKKLQMLWEPQQSGTEQHPEGIQQERYKKQQEFIKEGVEKGRSAIYTWGTAGFSKNTAGVRFIYEENDPRNKNPKLEELDQLGFIQNPLLKVFTDKNPLLEKALYGEVRDEKLAGKYGIYETVVITNTLPFEKRYQELHMNAMLQEPKFSVIYNVTDRHKQDPDSPSPNERRPQLFLDGIGRPGNGLTYVLDLPLTMKPAFMTLLQEDPTIMRKLLYANIDQKYSEEMQKNAKDWPIPFAAWNGEKNKELQKQYSDYNVDFGVNRMLVLDIPTLSLNELIAFKNPATEEKAIEYHTIEYKTHESTQTPDETAVILPKIS